MANSERRAEAEQRPPDTMGLDSPIWIGNRKAPNRFVHQAMECNDFLDGFPSKLSLRRYRSLAEGRAGITVVESTAVVASSLSRVHQLVGDEGHRRGIEELTVAFKRVNQDTLLCYQLTHPGQTADPRFSEVLRAYDAATPGAPGGRRLEATEIRGIREAFIRAAEIVHDSGADMVDVKLCHGYLGSQMLRPANVRGDEYGGGLANRMRFTREVIEGIRERIPDPGFKVMSRFSVWEAAPDGRPMVGGVGTRGPGSTELSLEEPYEMLRSLVGWGVEVLNVTGGVVAPQRVPEGLVVGEPRTYSAYHHISLANGVKDLRLGAPVICSGFSVFGEVLARVAQDCVSNGYTDMVGIGRQALADPDVGRILAGSANYCTRCRGCGELLGAQMPAGCAQFDPVYALLRKSVRLHSKP